MVICRDRALDTDAVIALRLVHDIHAIVSPLSRVQGVPLSRRHGRPCVALILSYGPGD